MNDIENFTEDDYNQMIIEILEKNIELNKINIILYLFFSVEFFLIFFGYITLNYFVIIPWILLTIKIWLNDREIKLNDSAIKHLEDLRDKQNKT